jgi:serine phosphatase RsbU (regulator of sigma subunit)
VSGDFYWIEENSDKIIMVVSDCTGHGIPGAFMSFIGIAYLEYIVISRKIFEPELILKELHIGIRHALKQSSGDNRDGMDASVVVLNKKDNVFSVLEYSGAMNPLYFIKQQEDGTRILEEIKANKLPIGGESEKERNYSKHTFSIQHEKITHIYLFSDGYQDQFGGKQNKKFKVKPFRDLISTICHQPMTTQKDILEQTLHNWMEEGKEPQTDDITVLGVKIV